MQDSALHARHELDHAGRANILDEPIDDFIAELAVSHLTAAETKARFYLVSLGEESDSLVLLGLVIVLVDGYRELNFLEGDDLLLFARCAFALFLLVEITAIILNSANRWDGSGRNLNQVEAPLTRDAERLKGLKDSKLLAIFVDDADFARANSIVDANEGLCRTFIECDGTPPNACRTGRGRAPRWAAEQRRKLSIALARPSEKRG
jgi:hypothetical protein